MEKTACQHGAILPKGLECVKGYLRLRLFHDNQPIFRPYGKHTKTAQKQAELFLNDIRNQMAMNTLELPKKLRGITFKEAFEIYFDHHYKNWHDPQNNKLTRSQNSKNTVKGCFKILLQRLGEKTSFDRITAKEVKRMKEDLLAKGVQPSTINRYKAALSSMYTVLERLGKDGTIEPLRLAKDNPCEHVEDLKEESRKRVFSDEEIQAIGKACVELKDENLLIAIKLSLIYGIRKGDLKQLRDKKPIDGMIRITMEKTRQDLELFDVPPEASQMNLTNLRKRWEAVRRKATDILQREGGRSTGIMDAIWYDLRRTAGHISKVKGTPIEHIQDGYGHKSKDTTQIYLNYKDQDLIIKPLLSARKSHLEGLGL